MSSKIVLWLIRYPFRQKKFLKLPIERRLLVVSNAIYRVL